MAIDVLTSLSILGFSIAFFTPATTDERVRLGAAMAMIAGIITLEGAFLCRYGIGFWMVQLASRSTKWLAPAGIF